MSDVIRLNNIAFLAKGWREKRDVADWWRGELAGGADQQQGNTQLVEDRYAEHVTNEKQH